MATATPTVNLDPNYTKGSSKTYRDIIQDAFTSAMCGSSITQLPGAGFRHMLAVALLIIQIAGALAAHARPNPVTISMSPDVEKVIKEADPKTVTRMKKAIKVGNQFIRLRFNNDDGYDPEIEDEWNKTVGPLVTMTGEQWFEWRDEQLPASLPIQLPGDWKQSTSLMACPAVTLSGINSRNNGYSLTYRAVLVGGYVEKFPGTPGKGGHREWIDKTQSGRPYNITLEIGPNYRIAGESSTEESLVLQYFYYRDDFARNAKVSGFVSEKYAAANRQLVNDLDAAASICKPTVTK